METLVYQDLMLMIPRPGEPAMDHDLVVAER